MARLSAFAVLMERPLVRNTGAEHTYVVSDEGHRWPCHGSAEGGRHIGTGRGEARLAACLARPDGMAGVRYGRTGVCHQIANRILWPADVRVDQAEGYRFSSTIFGHYGDRLGPWRERDICCQALGMEHVLAARSQGAMRKPPRPPREPARELEEPEIAYVTPPTDRDRFAEDRAAELGLLIEAQLGRGFDAGKRARVERIMADSAREQYDLVTAAEQGGLAADAYLERFTGLIRRTFGAIDRVLGRTDFERVFGAPPEQAAGIIDPVAYAEAHGVDRKS